MFPDKTFSNHKKLYGRLKLIPRKFLHQIGKLTGANYRIIIVIPEIWLPVLFSLLSSLYIRHGSYPGAEIPSLSAR